MIYTSVGILYISTIVRIQTHIHTIIYSMHINIHTHKQIFTQAYMHTSIRTHKHAYIHTSTDNIHTITHTHTNTHAWIRYCTLVSIIDTKLLDLYSVETSRQINKHRDRHRDLQAQKDRNRQTDRQAQRQTKR